MALLPKGVPVTLGLIAACVVCFLIQGATQQQFTNWGLLYAPEVARGAWWRVVSNAFLHGSGLHLLLNMGLLFALGQQLEQGIGSLRFGLVYAGSLATASLVVVLFAPNQPTLGASGAVMGVALGLGIAHFLFSRGGQHQSLLLLVAMNLALPLVMPGISFWGHFGGALGGLIMVGVLLAWPQHLRNKQISAGGVYSAERNPMASQAIGIATALVVAMLVGSVASA